MNEIISELKVVSGPYEIMHYFDSEHFYRAWRRGADEGIDSYPLQKLSTKYSKSKGRPDGFSERFRAAVTLILAAVIVFFSDYNESIPLLAPALFILGISRIYFMKDDLFPDTWTIIRYKNGEVASYIIHGKNNDAEREKFETELSEAIERSNVNNITT